MKGKQPLPSTTHRQKTEYLISLCLYALTLFLIIYAALTLIPMFIELGRSGANDEQILTEYLRGESTWRGLISLAALQILQVITILLPGAVVQIVGGLMFGTIPSFLICLVSFVFANTMIFYMDRHHVGIISRLIPRDAKSLKKISAYLNDADPGFMTMLAYMMPGVPNGFIPYVAAGTNVSLRRFILSVTIASAPHVLIMCAIGHTIMNGNWIFSAILFLISLMLIGILLYYKDKIITMRHKILKK
ncbi:MAG: VTT domain-containing protein [Lachnospiraceae bacterium]|nr:VTT domain-containing protein [Lachnospiraceae bacterium]